MGSYSSPGTPTLRPPNKLVVMSLLNIVALPAAGTVSRKSIVQTVEDFCFAEDGGTRIVINPPPPIPDENRLSVPT